MKRYCLDCDAEIPNKRIAAVPDCSFCVGCQPAHDKLADPTPALAVMGEMDGDFVGQWGLAKR